MWKKPLSDSAHFVPLHLDSSGGPGGSGLRPYAPALSLDAQFSLRATQSGGTLTQGMVPFTITDDYSQMAAGMLRATQAPSWTQTQDMAGISGGGGGGDARMKPSAVMDVYGAATQANEESQFPNMMESQQTGFAIGAGTQLGSQMGTQGGVSRNAMAPPPPRRRHMAKGSSSGGRGAAPNMSLEQMRRRNMVSAASKQARSRRVALYRTYRDGELPDIQAFTAKELLQPLQGLVLHDAALARIAFAWLFAEVHQRADGRTKEQLSASLNRLLADAPDDTAVVMFRFRFRFVVSSAASLCSACGTAFPLSTNFFKVGSQDLAFGFSKKI